MLVPLDDISNRNITRPRITIRGSTLKDPRMLDFVPRESNDFRGSLVPSDMQYDNVHNGDAHGGYNYVCFHGPYASNFGHNIHLFTSGSG